jgi:hypothetical protein
MRKGRFSKEEIAIIEQECESTPPKKIAESLNRDVGSVKKIIKEKLGKGLTRQEEIVHKAGYDLKSRPYWGDMKEQFSQEELEMFVYHWSRIIAQFRDDVFPTEEIQVIDAIKLELLMNRSLKEQRHSAESIDTFEQLLMTERQKDFADQDTDTIFNLERQVAVLRAATESISKDYKDLQTKKNSMLKELKGTREQRVKRLEDSKQNFTGWIRQLIEDPSFGFQLGKDMEKMRLAMEHERGRLSAYHKYEDGLVDQPFLTPESIKDD